MKHPMQGVLGKELRALTPFTVILISIQVLLWFTLSRASAHLVSPAVIVSIRTTVLVLAAALYGALFFGLEPPAARSFLLQLPITARRLVGAKVTAALLHMLAFWASTETLSQLLGWAVESSSASSLRLVFAALIYGCCAWLSTFVLEALSALVGGLILLILGSTAWLKLFPPPFNPSLDDVVPRLSLFAFAALASAIIGFTSIALWLRLSSREDLPHAPTPRRLQRFDRAMKPSLLALEWRQKRTVFLLLLILPLVLGALTWQQAGPFLIFLAGPVAGAILGVLVYTRPERDVGRSEFSEPREYGPSETLRDQGNYPQSSTELSTLPESNCKVGGSIWVMPPQPPVIPRSASSWITVCFRDFWFSFFMFGSLVIVLRWLSERFQTRDSPILHQA